jgi:hypothetical protein
VKPFINLTKSPTWIYDGNINNIIEFNPYFMKISKLKIEALNLNFQIILIIRQINAKLKKVLQYRDTQSAQYNWCNPGNLGQGFIQIILLAC